MKTKFLKTSIEMSKIYRTITGKGTLQLLQYIKKRVAEIKILTFNSGEKVFDWKIPHEWNVDDAFVSDIHGNKIIEFKKNPLHLMAYSKPVDIYVSKKELISKIYTNKFIPNAIPYVTGYYANDWAFCEKYNNVRKIKKLKSKKFHVKISSKFNSKGKLNVGEVFIKGKSNKEIFFSTNICHPYMANNESSGPTLAIEIINYIKKNIKNNYFSYRILFLPETIGAIAYLAKNYKIMQKNIIAGYVLTCVGDNHSYSLVLSPSENKLSDISLKSVLLNEKKLNIYSYLGRGSDERQYCSPNIDLPVTTFCRSKFGTYSQYHTSLDNHNFVSEKGFQGSFNVFKNIILSFENFYKPQSNFFGEPMMSKRNLYPSINLETNKFEERKYLDVLAFCNGKRNVFEISFKVNIDLENLFKILSVLKHKKLISVNYE